MLKDREFSRVLVFYRTKFGVEKLAKALSRLHIHAESIHGNKTQGARQRALEAFKAGKVSVLVATDVAARGLDIPAVSHVINYDLPSTYEDYVHRIGRTVRAALKGKALTFVQNANYLLRRQKRGAPSWAYSVRVKYSPIGEKLIVCGAGYISLRFVGTVRRERKKIIPHQMTFESEKDILEVSSER